MDKALYDQTINLVEKSQKILLLAHARVDCDGLGAALSAASILKEMGKEVTVATSDPAPENLAFLPSMEILQNSLSGSGDFIISIDTSKVPIGKLKYNKEDHKFNIIISPKDGMINEADVSFQHGMNKFDLIFVMDTGNLEHLGALYEDNVEMFFNTPVINIDHHASNTDFGQVNMVDVNASSTTEVLY
ncbi:DHH family phosphoesterase, partial [Candidatus Pacearchaeota archaeon]|nr:DHH family phosphoesterase [Candidatus Pacearchaeota archaeon]